MSAYRSSDVEPPPVREPIVIPLEIEDTLRTAYEEDKAALQSGCDVSSLTNCDWSSKSCCAKCKHRLLTFRAKQASEEALFRFIGAKVSERQRATPEESVPITTSAAQEPPVTVATAPDVQGRNVSWQRLVAFAFLAAIGTLNLILTATR